MINFLRHTKMYLGISTILIVLSFVFMTVFGFRFSIEFLGGSKLNYRLEKPTNKETINSILKEQKINPIEINIKKNDIVLRLPLINEKEEKVLRDAIAKKTKSKITILSTEMIGPSMSKDIINKTIIATILALFVILTYMSYSFKNFRFGFAAIIALVHDIIILLGTYSLLCRFFNAEFDSMFITALLTTMSFSVHDTIIMLDQLREYIKKEGSNGDIVSYANRSITTTIIRSFNNSMVSVFMLLALVLLGGDSIRFFVLALLIGSFCGTYSSPFIAIPVAVFLELKRKGIPFIKTLENGENA